MIPNSIKNLIWLLKNKRHFKNWKKRNFNPPAPEFIKHEVLKKNNLKNCLWIESGTYYGDTTNELSKISNKVVSIPPKLLVKNPKKVSDDKLSPIYNLLKSEKLADNKNESLNIIEKNDYESILNEYSKQMLLNYYNTVNTE